MPKHAELNGHTHANGESSDKSESAVDSQHAAPHVLMPTALYTLASAREVLGLRKNCLPREIRLGRLRVSKRAGRCFILGQWLLEWIEAGELNASSKTE